MMWEGSDRSRTRWRGEVHAFPACGTIVLPLRQEDRAFKLTCGFIPEEEFVEDRLDGIFEEIWGRVWPEEEYCARLGQKENNI